MKVTTISASVRYSRAINTGEYKTIELCAEAALDPSESWTEAQASLYAELGQQLKTLWPAKANASTNGNAQAEHHCAEHDKPFKRHERDGETWYSHKQGQGWCNEKGG